MKEKLKAHFLKWGSRRFVVVTVLLLTILDIVNSYYMKLYWQKKDMSTFMVHQSILRGNMSVEEFSRDTIYEMTGFVNNAFMFFLFLIFVNNLFFYLFYLRKKLWAQGYVLFYTLTAGIFSVSFLIDDVGLGWGWMLYNTLTIFLYLYLCAGVMLLKDETVIIPEGGKKGR